MQYVTVHDGNLQPKQVHGVICGPRLRGSARGAAGLECPSARPGHRAGAAAGRLAGEA